MPFDALTVAAIRQELEGKLVGGRVQRVVIPAPLSVGLEVYRAEVGRTHLLLSAHPQHARVHLLSSPPSRDPEQHPPLELLLRKYVRGGTITSVFQPAHERILGFSIVKRLRLGKHQEYHSDPYFMDNTGDESEEEEAGPEVPPTTVELVLEMMGKLSNIVLIEADGTVMDAMKRIPSTLNRYRVTLPNRLYVTPPPQDKRDPLTTSVAALSLEMQNAAEEDPKAAAWKTLVGAFRGVSPTLAREATHRALGGTQTRAGDVSRDPDALQTLITALNSLLALERTGAWEPCVAWQSVEGGRRGLDFAPYMLEHLAAQGATLERIDGISLAAATYYAELQTLGGHSAVREKVRAELAEIRARDERRLDALREQLKRGEAAEELRRKGEFLFAYMHTLTPGQRVLEVPDENLKVDLDPGLSHVENAQRYFKDYHKARSALQDLPELIEQAEMRVRFLDELSTSLDLAATLEDIRAVQAELNLARQPSGPPPEAAQTNAKGGRKPRKVQEKLPQPLRAQTSRGVPVLVGRTARQNDAATFRLAAPDDLWFHARNVPGSHVILRTGAGDATEDDVREAAELAAGYSSARQNGQVDVICTERRYVRKVPNSPPGFVTYKNERVLRVAPKRVAGK